MTSHTNRALVRAAERRLVRDSASMAYLDTLKREASRAGFRIAETAREEVWKQLVWTDNLLTEWQRQGQLTTQLEDRVSAELAYYLEQVGYRSEQGYRGIVRALSQAPALTASGRVELMMNACFLLVDEL